MSYDTATQQRHYSDPVATYRHPIAPSSRAKQMFNHNFERCSGGRGTSITSVKLVMLAITGLLALPPWGATWLHAQQETVDATEFAPAPIRLFDESFEVTVAAAPPLVKHPLMAGFDDRGRLYIAESAGENLRREDLEKRLPNFVRRLEDRDGDGVFDHSTIFADGLTLPQGALWHDGALYVAAPPNIWKFVDEDDDGVADRREVLVDQFGYTGNAASIHGCFLGPTGRLYWCDGRHGHEVHDETGELISAGKAARIFSCRADGSDFRVHCGGGMDNPVEIDFTPEGEMLGTVNLFYRQRGDCLVHWMHGGAYPRFDQTCVDEFRRTGDLLREVHNLGHVAVSGMTRLRSPQWNGDAEATSWLLTEFNAHRIMQTTLRRQGSTFAAEVRPLLESSSVDFHPTDVLEDADGSLLVIDTGGWFRIGCPTSQIAKPNILGAIYRVRRKGPSAPGLADSRGLKLDWTVAPAELAQRLEDPRHAVVERATSLLARQGGEAAQALAKWQPATTAGAVRRVWALARNGAPLAARELRLLLGADAWQLRLAAAMACGQTADHDAVESLMPLLSDEQPQVRREVATALGRIGDVRALPSLLHSLGRQDNDRVLEHALIYALMEIGDGAAIAPGLADSDPRVQRGALIALDQMPWDGLRQEHVTPLLASADTQLVAAALDAVATRPAWSEEGLRQLRSLFAASRGGGLDETRRRAANGLLQSLSSHAELPALIAASGSELAASDQVMLLQFLGSRPQLPEACADFVQAGLAAAEADVARAAVHTLSAHPDPRHADSLLRLGRDERRPTDLRVAAWQAWALSARQPLDESAFSFLGSCLTEQEDPLLRLAAARGLAAAPSTPEQARQAARWAAKAGPIELPVLTGAWAGHTDPALGKLVVAALGQAPGASALSLAAIEEVVRNFPPEIRDAAEPLLESRRAELSQRSEQLAMHVEASDGDAARGQRVFLSRAAGCAACHRVAGEGGNVGPDLSTIGDRRSKRDLLEAVLFPSASQARGFESYLIRLDDGRQFAGLILSESGSRLRVRTSDQQELEISREAIEAMKPSDVSVMPAGLKQTMTDGQLQDLVAYLRTLRATSP
ncbi:MAG: HEAT repeat domain-containing protein [Planctomycetales bacterium]|nr:HEAT repeat domain-containing protein [Planctomycetales bacterium]